MPHSLPGRTIVAFGDSITHGHQVKQPHRWTDLLEAALNHHTTDGRCRVINAGIGGNTSAEGLQRLERDVLPHLPALVLVEFGNDVTQNPARHVPVEGYKANLRTIHRAVTGKGGQVMLMTFPPIVDDWHAHRNEPAYLAVGGQDRYFIPYRQATRRLADELGCFFFDLDGLIRQRAIQEGWEQYIIRDGVHLTDKAHQLVAQALASHVHGLPG